MGYEGGGLLLAVGCRAAARSLCAQAVGSDLGGLAAQFSDKNTLEVCIHVMCYTNRRLYLFTQYVYSCSMQ